jgi:hypothetical protein
MIDRLVCADGGNPDPTSTHGKKPEEAKAMELKGWDYPKHLAGRLFSIVVHGDSVGAETLRRTLSDWLIDMDLISAGSMSEIDGYIGYEEPYATRHLMTIMPFSRMCGRQQQRSRLPSSCKPKISYKGPIVVCVKQSSNNCCAKIIQILIQT